MTANVKPTTSSTHYITPSVEVFAAFVPQVLCGSKDGEIEDPGHQYID